MVRTKHISCIYTQIAKVHGANMGPTWDLSAPDGPHVGPMNLAVRVHDWQLEIQLCPLEHIFSYILIRDKSSHLWRWNLGSFVSAKSINISWNTLFHGILCYKHWSFMSWMELDCLNVCSNVMRTLQCTLFESNFHICPHSMHISIMYLLNVCEVSFASSENFHGNVFMEVVSFSKAYQWWRMDINRFVWQFNKQQAYVSALHRFLFDITL